MGDDNRFAMIPLAAIADERMTFRTLKTFAAICSFRASSNDYRVEASREEIAIRCGFNASIVSTATTELQRLGWLVKEGFGGRGLKTKYTITTPETVLISETVAESETVLKSETVTESETVAESVSKTVSTSGTLLYKKEVNTEICAKKPSADPNGFTEFWDCYPKKVGKVAAEKAWKKLKPAGQLLADLMTGLQRQKGSTDWQKDAGQFIPHPTTWLNGRRWEDEPVGNATRQPATHDKRPQPGESRLRFGATEVFTETAGWVPA